jgi:hypothetical protein
MRKRCLTSLLGVALAAAAMAAAVNAPAEVIDNLDFFSDFELLANLEILENDGPDGDLAVPAGGIVLSTAAFAAQVSTLTVTVSSGTVALSTSTWRPYEKR